MKAVGEIRSKAAERQDDSQHIFETMNNGQQ
jgi:hypothetical protein